MRSAMMTVAQLIGKLQKVNPDLPVVYPCECWYEIAEEVMEKEMGDDEVLGYRSETFGGPAVVIF